MDPVTQHLISSYLLMPILTVIFGIAAYRCRGGCFAKRLLRKTEKGIRTLALLW